MCRSLPETQKTVTYLRLPLLGLWYEPKWIHTRAVSMRWYNVKIKFAVGYVANTYIKFCGVTNVNLNELIGIAQSTFADDMTVSKHQLTNAENIIHVCQTLSRVNKAV